MENSGKGVMSENERNAPDSYAGVSKESVRNIKDEINLNNPASSPFTISFYYSSPPPLAQVSNPDYERSPVSDNYGIEVNNYGATDMFNWYEGGKNPYSTVVRTKIPISLKSFQLWFYLQY